MLCFDFLKVYSGTFHKGEMTGWGSKKWPDGRAYRGPFVLGDIFITIFFSSLFFLLILFYFEFLIASLIVTRDGR